MFGVARLIPSLNPIPYGQMVHAAGFGYVPDELQLWRGWSFKTVIVALQG